MSRILARGTLIYLGAVNVGAIGLFAYDKVQASRGAWRVPERTLCESAKLGGWPGGLIAMQTFRHKTRKKSFQEKYVAAAGQNALGMALALFLATRSQQFRAALMRDISLIRGGLFGSGGRGGGRGSGRGGGRGRRR